MRPLAGLFGMAFVTGLSGALMPGPVLAVVVGGAAQWGALAGIAAILGHAAVEVPVVVLLMAGLGALVARPRVLAAIGLVGGLALLLSGADMVRSAAAVGSGLQPAAAPMGLVGMALAGAGASLANPYFALWWATVGAGQIATVGPRSPTAWVTFYLGHVSSDFLWYAVVAFAIGSGRQVLGATGHRVLIMACGVALLALGCYFMVTGVRRARTGVEATHQGAGPG